MPSFLGITKCSLSYWIAFLIYVLISYYFILLAIKKVNELFEDIVDSKRVLREITLLRFMKNRCIVELLDIEYDRKNKNFEESDRIRNILINKGIL